MSLMDAYRDQEHAEHRLDDALAEAVGCREWWSRGTGEPPPFGDWYYDTHDWSVELLDARPGWEPSPEALSKLFLAGIHSVFISYSGSNLDERGTEERPAAVQWFVRDGQWQRGRCSARESRGATTATMRDLYRRVAELERQIEGAAR